MSSIRDAIKTERQLRPLPIGPSGRNLKKAYTYALFGVAILTVLAFVNNREQFNVAFLIALILAALYVSWVGHRAVLLTLAALVWWVLTVPLIAFVTSDNLLNPSERFSFAAAPIYLATAVGVWLGALLIRARRPWLTILIGWAINLVAVLVTSAVAPRYGFHVAWAALLLYFAWRAGLLLASYDWLRGRTQVGRDYDQATEAQYQVYQRLDDLPSGYRLFFQVSPSTDNGNHLVTADVLVAGPTGLSYIAVLDRKGEITVAAGRPRRVLVNGKPTDSLLRKIAATSAALRQALDLEFQTFVVLPDATFPNRGLLATRVRLPGDVEPIDVTLIDEKLVVRRIRFGRPVYTAGQLHGVMHRLRTRLRSAEIPPLATPPREANNVVKLSKNAKSSAQLGEGIV